MSERPSGPDPEAAAAFTVAVSSCLVYMIPAPAQHGFVQGIWDLALGAPDIWDLGAPWYPWAEQPEPVKAIHIDLVWGLVPVQVSSISTHSAAQVYHLVATR
jgi:hypothetical protein